ncbi:hypothetical protein F5884DRAFT_757514 [Xylogone sp. PMI_703]|nr:hypothetical protein F5884DRAFT_757514 [Xylogone sp. PMI_703]
MQFQLPARCLATVALSIAVSQVFAFQPHQCDAHGTPTPRYTYDELWDMTINFWDNMMYPDNVQNCKDAKNSTFFTDATIGRVDVTEVFPGRELNAEYSFCLFSPIVPTNKTIPLIGVPTNYTITHFAATDYIVAISLIVDLRVDLLNLTTPLEFVAFFTWDENGKVSQYDATLRRFGEYLDMLFEAATPLLNATTPTETTEKLDELITTGVCATATQYCVGPNQQYTSEQDCQAFMKTVRFGTSYELGKNTVLCRLVHEKMVPQDPDVHCPHIGPTGGNMCVDGLTYDEEVLQPVFTNAPFVVTPKHRVRS